MNTAAASSLVELDVEGMTCTACAARIETNLNKLDSVEASVSFATEKATVRFAPQLLDVGRLIGAIRDTGYDAQVARAGSASSAGARVCCPTARRPRSIFCAPKDGESAWRATA